MKEKDPNRRTSPNTVNAPIKVPIICRNASFIDAWKDVRTEINAVIAATIADT
jgi:hypothetical protein